MPVYEFLYDLGCAWRISEA